MRFLAVMLCFLVCTVPVGAAAPRQLNSAEEAALARFCAVQAEGEPMLAQLSLAAVMLNRCADARFPDQLSCVLAGAGFTAAPAATADYETALFAVRCAARGMDPTGGALFWRHGDAGMEFY